MQSKDFSLFLGVSSFINWKSADKNETKKINDVCSGHVTSNNPNPNKTI
jgi:hypothetical protein